MINLKESAGSEEEVLASFKYPNQKQIAQSFMTSAKHAVNRMFNSYPFYSGRGTGQLTRKQAEDAFNGAQYAAKMNEAERDQIGTGPYGMTMPPSLNDWWNGLWGSAWKKIETEYQFKEVKSAPKEEPIQGVPLMPKEPLVRKMTPYERTKADVYATGNKWAIDNFNATHDRGW